jgi:gp16 family phage-associated protein
MYFNSHQQRSKKGDLMTPSEVKASFEAQGIPVSQWADQHGYPRSEVYRILNGFAACKRGRAHEIATKLGIKPSASNRRIPA